MTAHRPVEESYDREVDLRMWRKLFRYALHYRRDMTLLAVMGVLTAAADVAMPLVTRNIIDAAPEAPSSTFLGSTSLSSTSGPAGPTSVSSVERSKVLSHTFFIAFLSCLAVGAANSPGFGRDQRLLRADEVDLCLVNRLESAYSAPNRMFFGTRTRDRESVAGIHGTPCAGTHRRPPVRR